MSEHSKHNTSCQDCHGSAHTNEDDVDEAAIPNPEAFDAEREKLIKVCSNCHSKKFARAEMVKGDETIREIDHLMAEAIRIVSALYEQGLLEKPDSYAYDFPDLLAFHDAPTTIEQRLFVMHLEHRAGILLPCSLCRHGQAP